MKERDVKDYCFIAPAICTLETGVHLALTQLDLTLLPTKELNVMTGRPKNIMKVGFNSSQDLTLALLEESWLILQHLKEFNSDSLDKYFYPFGSFMKSKEPRIDNIADMGKLQFFQTYVNGGGRDRATIIKLYKIAADFMKFKMGQIMNDNKKKVNHTQGAIEIEIDLEDKDINKELSSFMAELLDDQTLTSLIDYIQLEITNSVQSGIDNYVMYKGDIGSARVRELIRFAKSNITVNSKETLKIDKRLNEQMALIYQEGVVERDVHLVIDAPEKTSEEFGKAMLWIKREDKHSILYNALKYLPLVDNPPEEQLYGIYSADGEEIKDIEFIEDLEEEIACDVHSLSDKLNQFSQYKELFKESKFKSITEIVDTLKRNGSLEAYALNKTNAESPSDVIATYTHVEEEPTTIEIGKTLMDMSKGLSSAVEHSHKVMDSILKDIDRIGTVINDKAGTNLQQLLKDKIQQVESKVSNIGQTLSVPATCGTMGKDVAYEELLKLTSAKYKDGLISNNLRETQISPLQLWKPGEELIEGVSLPEPVKQYLTLSAKQVVESLLILSITANKKHFEKQYMSLTEDDSTEEITHKIDTVYKDIMEFGE